MLNIDGSVWELAHQDGSSIFVRHGPRDQDHITFGPFLFTTLEELEESEGTLGPHGLLAALEGKEILAQQISKTWVVEHTLIQFDPLMTDAVVIGELLLPLTTKGAIFVDEIDDPSDSPWQQIVKTYGEDTHRFIVAQMVGQMFGQAEYH